MSKVQKKKSDKVFDFDISPRDYVKTVDMVENIYDDGLKSPFKNQKKKAGGLASLLDKTKSLRESHSKQKAKLRKRSEIDPEILDVLKDFGQEP